MDESSFVDDNDVPEVGENSKVCPSPFSHGCTTWSVITRFIEIWNFQVMKDCLEAFHKKDSICEASIFKTVKKYFNAGGTPEEVVNVLAESFEGVGNLARQLVLWLEFCGESTSSIEKMVEDHVKDLLEENFDPKKADTIFSDEGLDLS